MSMKTIFIDDDQLALDLLEHQMKKFSDLQIKGKFKDPRKAVQFLEENHVDIVFLDIHLPNINGIELAEKLKRKKSGLHIVFVTGHDKYAIQAFEINALDYLLKPVSVSRLSNTLKRIRQKVTHSTRENHKKENQLKMELFQRFAIIDQNEKEVSLNWRTTKVEQLFYYLLHRRNQVVEKTELIELLWRNLDLKNAFSQLYTATYHIRKVLEPFDRHIQLTNTSIGYMLTLEDVSLDIDEFEKIVRQDDNISPDNLSEFEYAIDLYKGDYLQGYDYFWIESERQRLAQLWMRVSSKMLNWYLQHREIDKVIELATKMNHRFPLEEEAYLYMMKAYAARNQRSIVEQIYHQLTEMLMNEIEEKPRPDILKWYENWKRKTMEKLI